MIAALTRKSASLSQACRGFLVLVALSTFVLSAGAQTATPAFVQANSAVPQSLSVPSVQVTFTAAQAAGNLNVVIVGWNSTSGAVTSMTDSSGNVYARAIGLTAGTALTQSIYYAKNIVAAAAGANRVAVAFSPAVAMPDVRILEYRGIDTTNPVDSAVGGSGSSATSSSGTAVTTNATDLLIAGNMVFTSTRTAGTGYNSRVITNPDGDVAEDRVVTATGSYSATASLSSSGPWVMQLVAFRAAAGGGTSDTTSPTAPTSLVGTPISTSQINLTWTASTDNVGVTGYRVERCQGAGCTNYSQIATPAGTAYSDTGLSASTSYSYRVRAEDAAGNLSAYSTIATAVTQTPSDTSPPSAPTNLSAMVVSTSQINLSWTAATDNVGVTGYRVERCQGAGCSSFVFVGTTASTTFSDSGLAAFTTYAYRVRATDAVGNLSGYSNIATATTSAGTTPATPQFVQVNSAIPTSSPTSVPVIFTAAQTAGDTNVVVVGWNDSTASVSSVTDSMSNNYRLAVGPTVGSALTQAIYYATNISAAPAGANQVTVTFNPAASLPDVRILEYQGIDTPFPTDGTAAATGSSATSSTASVATANANDMIFGANIVYTATSGAGTNFTSRVITSPNGDIAEDRVVSATGSYSATAPLTGAGPWVMQMVVFRAAGSPPPPPDTIPPMVSITSPAQGATVLGFVTVTANASDNVAVAGVQFKADGVNIGSEITKGLYSVIWDTSGLTSGASHTLTAVARDTSNNTTTSSPITVTVQSASTLGQWQGPFSMPLVAVHTIYLSNGKLLFFDGQENGPYAQVWDPANNSFTQVTAPINVFCSGHTLLPDGRVIVAGGHSGAHIGLNGLNTFDPQTQSWITGPSMAAARWYPTTTALPDGRVIVLSGETSCNGCSVDQPQIYNPATNSWTTLTNAVFSMPYYPHVFVLPDGRVLVSSTTEDPIISRVLNLNTQTWTPIGATAPDGGSAAMYRPGMILKTGTSVDPDTAVRSSFATAYVLDMNQTSPAWRQVAPMAYPRTYHTQVLLPDGNVFVEGGGRTTEPVNPSNAVFAAEIWSPATETWTTVASMTTPRLYHSTALLLPDGRVFVAGGGRFDPGTVPTDRFNYEYYLPPYLFKGPRPTITSAPGTVQYAQAFTVQTPDAAQIASVVLMRLGSVTHNFNMSQNYVPLTFTAGSGSLNVQGPANSNLAPPGYYMLFIVNTNGVPSIASILQLPVTSGATQPPTAPTTLVATGALGSASLSWSASTGPNGVSGYSVYRSNAPGVVPSPTLRIAQPPGTSYTDASFPASGTYYYVVTARDPLGNESAASNEAVATVTADTTPPSTPGTLNATSVSNSQINLSWGASTDDVGVTSYRVERCQGAGCSNFAQIATPAGTAYGDAGLAASTSYSYRVRAADAAGNLSGYSNTATATTAATPPVVATPTFVQGSNAVPQSSSVASVLVTFSSSQTAGNLNVVIVGWNDTTAVVTSVTDTSNNVYTRAVGPTLGTALSQSIYYAKNIVAAGAGVNRVTVAFSPVANAPDVRILEYRGIDSTNSVDTTAAAVGNSATSDSGPGLTTNPNDLLVAGNIVFTSTTGSGTGFTSRMITSPDGDIAEDRVSTSTGSFNAAAPLSSAGAWVMQLVAFRAAGSPPPALAVEGGNPIP
jgi:fibronectin type 3 domain-containing protein